MKKTMKLLPLGALLILISALAQAQTIYNDRTAFEADFPALPTEDFESGDPLGFACEAPGPLDAAGDGLCFGLNDLLSGVVYNSTSDESPNELALVIGGFFTPSQVLGANFFVEDTLLTFSEPGNTAVGFNLWCFSPSAATISVYGTGGLIAEEAVNCGPSGLFFGIDAGEMIADIEIANGAGDVIDDLMFTAGTPADAASVARFAVSKDFTDDNPREVEVTITCDTGLPLQQSLKIRDPATVPDLPFSPETATAFVPPTPGVVFVVKEFVDGSMDCTVTEEEINGYEANYIASGDGQAVGGPESCEFSNVQFEDKHSCVIVNSLEPVPVVISKEWEFSEGNIGVKDEAKISLNCTNVAGGSTDYWSWWINGDEDNTANVYPRWDGTTTCSVSERVFDSAVESTGCESVISVEVGDRNDGCLITNTVFFEGIPTLSQYGVALMALLMLGVGLVGFRRFS